LIEKYEALGYGFHDLLMYVVDGEIAFDKHYALGLALGDLAVFEPYSTKKFILLLFEAAFAGTGLLLDTVVAAARAGD
jgi:hypothetical protein